MGAKPDRDEEWLKEEIEKIEMANFELDTGDSDGESKFTVDGEAVDPYSD